MIRFPFADARAQIRNPKSVRPGSPQRKHLPMRDETSMTETFRFAVAELAMHAFREKPLHGTADFVDCGAA